MTSKENFDVLDIFKVLNIHKVKIFIFTIVYFFIVFLVDDKLKSFVTKSKFLQINISVSALETLPDHYLNLDNMLYLNDNFGLEKNSFISNYFSKNAHLIYFISHYRFPENDKNKHNQFLKEINVSKITDTEIILKIYNQNYYKNIDSDKVISIIDDINQSLHREIANITDNFNLSLMKLETILQEIDYGRENNLNYNTNNKPLYLFNSEVINDFVKNSFSRVFSVTSVKELELIENPYNIFNKFKLYIFYFTFYIVMSLMIIIFFYSSYLTKNKKK